VYILVASRKGGEGAKYEEGTMSITFLSIIFILLYLSALQTMFDLCFLKKTSTSLTPEHQLNMSNIIIIFFPEL
jgi:hypothetical protein